MTFFKVKIYLSEEEWNSAMGPRDTIQDRLMEISEKTDEFNDTRDYIDPIFVVKHEWPSMEKHGMITIYASFQKGAFQKDVLNNYLTHVFGMSFHNMKICEIMAKDFFYELDYAQGKYVYDISEDVEDAMGVDHGIAKRLFRMHEIQEIMLKDRRQKDLVRKSEKAFFSKDKLIPELKRILEVKDPSPARAHPVHYVMLMDEEGRTKKMVQTLLQALWQQKRIQNKRYVTWHKDYRETFSHWEKELETIYKLNAGGAVAFLFHPAEEEEDNINRGEHEALDEICKEISRNRNQVLTIFCLPRNAKRARERFYENLPGMVFVELSEDLLKDDSAITFLQCKAAERDVDQDEELFGQVEEGKSYLPMELDYTFEVWYSRKYRELHFPQYATLAPVSQKTAKAAPKGNAYGELDAMIGLSEAKAVIRKAVDYYKAQTLFAEKGMAKDSPAMHMVFSGNPGTAKTTVARLFAQIMKENGVLDSGHLVEVGRSDLVGKYMGWTAKIVKEKFGEAKGGVLFIDEAYSLVEDRSGLYGDEAINTIVQEMENHRKDLVVIFAGYPDKMQDFLDKNPGLRSRIAFHVPFADYDTKELCAITEYLASKKGLHLTPSARKKLVGIYDAVRCETDFGNGRYVRNLLEQARMNQASRLLKGNLDSLTPKEVATITAKDLEFLETAVSLAKKAGHTHKTIGFLWPDQ